MAMDTSSYGSHNRAVTAFFDRHTDAEEAVSRLRAAGFDDDRIRLVQGARPGMEETAATETGRRSGGGFWDALADLFMPDTDRDTYAEGLSRGGYLVTVWTDTSTYETALDILDDEGTVDIDERADTWRAEGWTGGARGPSVDDWSAADRTSGAGTTGAGGLGMGSGTGSGLAGSGLADRTGATGLGWGSTGSGGTSALDRSDTGLGASGSGMAAGGSAAGGMTGRDAGSTAYEAGSTRTTGTGSDRMSGAARSGDDEDAIPVVKEELKVGKRDVSHGRVRVRSYVVEEPVEASVGLRSERVDVERRPVDRPAGADLFRDRTIEAVEHTEEPVVTKDARVTEELVLNKTAREEQRTVSDTVRRTEVEIEDERGTSRTDGTRSDR